MKPIYLLLLSTWGWFLVNAGAGSAREEEQLPPVSRNCPREIEPLTAWMLQDLPSYANRVIQRSRQVGKSRKPTLSVFITGKPEYKPLTVSPGLYIPKDSVDKAEPQQVFFTTWERFYEKDRIGEIQQYHWAFLTYTASGWRLAALYSSLGSYPQTKPPTPIRESSEDSIGRGLKLWLRDCAVGKLRSSSPTLTAPTSN